MSVRPSAHIAGFRLVGESGFSLKVISGLALLAGVLATGLSSPAQAQFRDPHAAVKYRGAAMVMMGTHLGRLTSVARNELPFDQAVVQENVDVLKMLVELPWPAYAKGYEGGEARSNVWTDRDGFQGRAQDLKVAVKQLDTATQAGDLDAFRLAVGKVGQSCKACHDSYRIKK